ncbi:oxidation resistance protein 1 [Monosporozyma servazzii]
MGMRTALYKLSRSWTLGETSDEGTTKDSSEQNLPLGKGPSPVNTTSTIPDDYRLPIDLIGYNAGTKNKLLNKEMGQELRTLFPSRIQLYMDWTLVYSLEQHGASLQSLYGNIEKTQIPKRRVGYLLVVRDSRGGIFGGYCNEPWLPNEHRRYGGNGECFLWKLDKVQDIDLNSKDKSEEEEERLVDEKTKKQGGSGWRLVGFPHTGVNEFAMYCTSQFLSMGAGDGHYGIWVDDGLLRGVSYPCLTYGNEPLSQEGEKFHITGLEVWRIGGGGRKDMMNHY